MPKLQVSLQHKFRLSTESFSQESFNDNIRMRIDKTYKI